MPVYGNLWDWLKSLPGRFIDWLTGGDPPPPDDPDTEEP